MVIRFKRFFLSKGAQRTHNYQVRQELKQVFKDGGGRNCKNIQEYKGVSIRIYGEVSQEVIEAVKHGIDLIPYPYTKALASLKDILITDITDINYDLDGCFEESDFIKLFVSKKQSPNYFTQVFLHEFGHLIYHSLEIQFPELIEKYWEIINSGKIIHKGKKYKIKPFSDYSKAWKKNKFMYPNELFAEYFSIEYSDVLRIDDCRDNFKNYRIFKFLFHALTKKIIEEMDKSKDERERMEKSFRALHKFKRRI